MKNNLLEAHRIIKRICDNVEIVIVGKRQVIELAMVALLSQGHLLIEDAPGLGKTMFARSLAKSIGTKFKRIQFTPDMLPSDVTGVSVFNQKTGDFEFHPGPVMTNIVLADEINRATPKAQSALLECMEEHQITVDGNTHLMPRPFHIIATLNPIEYEGTFPLPETQLDRFLLRLDLGYPTLEDEVIIMENQQYGHPIERIGKVADEDELLQLQQYVKQIYVDILIKQYIASLVELTRHHPAIHLGSSPRGSLALFRAAQAYALMNERDYVLPDDIKSLAVSVLAHRIVVNPGQNGYDNKGIDAISEILEKVSVPGTIPASRLRTR